MICLDSRNARGKRWTQSLPRYFFSFIFTFIKCKLIIRNIFLLTLLTIRKSERASNQGIYNQGIKLLVTTKDIKKGERAW